VNTQANLVRVTELWKLAQRLGEFGIQTGELSLNWPVAVARARRIVAGCADPKPTNLTAHGATLIFGSARFEDAHSEIIEILLEATPRDINLAALVQDMTGVEGVQEVHDVHVWSITSGLYALSCHVLIDDLPPSQSASILHALETLLAEQYQIGHTTIQFESQAEQEPSCSVDSLYCQ
jgi:hypothetical protein